MDEVAEGRPMIVIGRNAARALGIERELDLSTGRLGESDFLLVPHPSGMNRIWNDEGFCASAKRALREFVRRVES